MLKTFKTLLNMLLKFKFFFETFGRSGQRFKKIFKRLASCSKRLKILLNVWVPAKRLKKLLNVWVPLAKPLKTLLNV